MDRLFLDANVLFSAAYREDAGVRKLWDLREAELVTSAYAVEEARRNLDTGERRSDLGGLLEAVRVSNLLADPTAFPEIEASGLPEKDLPILRAAVASGATYLVTGDRKHFGDLLAKRSPKCSCCAQRSFSRCGPRSPATTRPDDGLPVEGRRLSPYAAQGPP